MLDVGCDPKIPEDDDDVVAVGVPNTDWLDVDCDPKIPDDDDDEQSFEMTLSSEQPGTEATTSGAVVLEESSKNTTRGTTSFPDVEENCISGLVCGGRCLATHQV